MAYPTIHQIATITQTLSYLDTAIEPKDTLIVLDIDNTIAQIPNQLGSPQWLSSAIKEKMRRDKISKDDALEKTLSFYFSFLEYTTLVPVETTTVNFIHILQKAGYKVIALTARGVTTKDKHTKNEARLTITQLNKMGVDLRSSSIAKQDVNFGNRVAFIDGAYFVGGANKGEELIRLLKHTRYAPKLIIFVDDKDYNINAMEGALKQHGYESRSLWYRFLDPKVNAFRLSMTQDILKQLCKQDATVKKAYKEWLRHDKHTKHESVNAQSHCQHSAHAQSNV